MQTVTFTMVSGKTIRHMASVFTTTPMAVATKVTGSTTRDRAREYTFGKMVLNTMVNG